MQKKYFFILIFVAICTGWFLEIKISDGVRDIEDIAKVSLVKGKGSGSKLKPFISPSLSLEEISSPVKISGEAPGTWFFEANIIVNILDKEGNVLGSGHGTALGEWMTEGYVPFEAVVSFDTPYQTDGFIEVLPDNPSGLPDSRILRVPIHFSR